MMAPEDHGSPDWDGAARHDLAYRLLAAAVRMMRSSRRDWGLAMLAELERIHPPGDRAWFALGASWVALFPPRVGRPWWPVPLGLAIRAVIAGAAIHALAPAAGAAPLVLITLPTAGAWAVLTMPVLVGRPGSAVSLGQVTVVAGVVGCLLLALATVQHYPQVLSTGAAHGWGTGVVLDVISAGYLGLAWLLPRRFAPARRNSLYALAGALVVAAAAAQYIARPSLVGLWQGTMPAEYLLACLALPAAAALASIHGGRVGDGLETAVWAALLAGLTTSIMIIAATYRVAPLADGSRPIIADAHLHGMTSASTWLVGDNLGGATFLLFCTPLVFATVSVIGAVVGSFLRTAALDRVPAGWRPPGQ
jgi:hypothetical protein